MPILNAKPESSGVYIIINIYPSKYNPNIREARCQAIKKGKEKIHALGLEQWSDRLGLQGATRYCTKNKR